MSAKTIIVQEDLAAEVLEYLEGAGLEVVSAVGWDEDMVRERIASCQGLIVGPATRVTADLLRAAANLEVVGRTGASVDAVDVATATRLGIVVVNTPQSNVVSAGEQAMALLLACARNLAQTHADLKAGRWDEDKWAGTGVEVRGKTLGIIGLGRVGARLAHDARALGMDVVAYDPAMAPEHVHELPLMRVDDPARVYAAADFIVVHLPDSADAQGFVGRDAFARMRDGVRVISLSRPGVVDRKAWLAALESGKVAASAVMVFEGDAVDGDPLASRENVLFAAHLDASTVDARLRAGMAVAEQVAAAVRGQVASNAVNVPLALGDDAAELMPYMGLCTQLGRLVVHLAGSPVSSVEIRYGGSFAYYDTRILTLGVLAGVLHDAVHERVNFVNAQSIADERGVIAKETRQTDVPDFPWIITVSASGAHGDLSVSGTSLGAQHKPRLVRAFGEDIDIEPAPHMLFLRYADRPGVGGAVGTLLGQWGVNIGHMSVGRGAVENEAVMALTLDEPLSAGQLDELVKSCGLEDGKGVEL